MASRLLQYLTVQELPCQCSACTGAWKRAWEAEASAPEVAPTYDFLLKPKLPEVREPRRRLWSEEQIIAAVIAYDGGCGPGKRDWLKRMLGIEVNEYGVRKHEAEPESTVFKMEWEFTIDPVEYGRACNGPGDEVQRIESAAGWLRPRYIGRDLPSWLKARRITLMKET